MYNRILVPLDGSSMSECAIKEVKDIALGCHVPEVVLLTVVEPGERGVPFLWGGAGTAQPSDVAEIKKDREEMAKMDDRAAASAGTYLQKVADSLSKEGVNVKTQVLRGKAGDAIMDYAVKNGVDLIVMSTHGRGGRNQIDFGKVTDRIIRTSSIPVVVASPPGCRI